MLIQDLVRHDSIVASQWLVVEFCNTIGQKATLQTICTISQAVVIREESNELTTSVRVPMAEALLLDAVPRRELSLPASSARRLRYRVRNRGICMWRPSTIAECVLPTAVRAARQSDVITLANRHSARTIMVALRSGAAKGVDGGYHGRM